MKSKCTQVYYIGSGLANSTLSLTPHIEFRITVQSFAIIFSVVQYQWYLSKYCDTKHDDTSIAEVTVYRGAMTLVSIMIWWYNTSLSHSTVGNVCTLQYEIQSQ